MRGMNLMSRHLKTHVVGYLALAVALGGTSYAAVRLPANSVKAKQIARNAVGAPEIKRDAVRAAEIRRGAVRSTDVGDETLGSRDLAAASVGGDELQDGSVSLADLGIKPLVDGDVDPGGLLLAEPVSLPEPTGSFVDVGTFKLRAGGPALILVSGAVQISDVDDGNDALVELRLRHNDHVEPITFKQTIPDGGIGTSPVSLQCNGSIPGEHVFTLQVATTGSAVNVGPRSMDAVAFRPIPNPP
jgi:hypothetical protein